MTSFTVGPPSGEAEIDAYGLVVKQVYNAVDDVRRREWLAGAGHANIRVVRECGAVVGGLILIPMGQWFGGRAVPMNGVAAVAVLPEHRGRGAATALMRDVVAEMRRGGFPISSLFPATSPLYRSVGYERAGGEYRVSVPARAMHGGDRTLGVRAASPADEPVIDEVYRRRAALSCGNLERGAYVWERIRRPRVGIVSGYVVEGDAGIEGYVYSTTRETTTGDIDFTLWCPDVVALTAAAARRLVAFFADHRSMTGEIAWRGSPADPLLAVMREQHDVSVKLSNVWMVRILDVAAALAARGYPIGLNAELHFDVAADELLPQNAGRLVLRVADRRGTVERGGSGSVRLDVRGLAALYTGFQSPAELRASGAIDASDADLARASAVFAGPHPWIADHF